MTVVVVVDEWNSCALRRVSKETVAFLIFNKLKKREPIHIIFDVLLS